MDGFQPPEGNLPTVLMNQVPKRMRRLHDNRYNPAAVSRRLITVQNWALASI